ncbi:MAG TPA: hypothetical protein VEF76_01905 [Patescibacteria group bacterium]|nr:hypothetical protein [Patescibacteria group bacterium]
MADDPANDPYGKPPKDIFKDFLDAASRTVEVNESLAAEQAARKAERDAMRIRLQDQYDEARDGLRDKYEGHLQPILAALESLPAKDGRKFHVKLEFSDGGVAAAAEALDEYLYNGPCLTISVRYDKDWGTPPKPDEIQPMIQITIAPGNSYAPNEELTVKRFDKLYESWDQGGMTAKSHDESNAYGYDDLRQKLGEWLGDNAGDRLQDVIEAKNGPPPKPPSLPPTVKKYKGGALKP